MMAAWIRSYGLVHIALVAFAVTAALSMREPAFAKDPSPSPTATAGAVPTASQLASGTAAAEAIDPRLNGAAKLADAILWPLTLIAVIALLAPAARAYLMVISDRQAIRREEQHALSRANWAYSDSVTVTETVATIVAAAVAARLIKAGGNVEETIPYEKLRSIVRRMTQSINIGETRGLQGAHIAWVHQRDAEDYYEQHAFENLGAHVKFFTDNHSLLEYVKEQGSSIVAIVSNRNHWLEATDEQKGVPRNPEAAAHLLPQLKTTLKAIDLDIPILIYSRSVDDSYGEKLRSLGAALYTDIPEVIFHRVFSAADTASQRPPVKHRPARRSVADSRSNTRTVKHDDYLNPSTTNTAR